MAAMECDIGCVGSAVDKAVVGIDCNDWSSCLRVAGFNKLLLDVLSVFGGVLDADSHRESERDNDLDRSRLILLLSDGECDRDFCLRGSRRDDFLPRDLLLDRERDGDRDAESLPL